MRILVVDDHAVVRQGVQRLLTTLPGAEVTEAEGVGDGMAALAAVRPDVVVLDINLKDGSGIDLLRKMKAVDPAARVVVFSMYSDVIYATSARRAGALGFVSKGAAPDELLVAVEKAARGETHVDADMAEALGAQSAPEGRGLTARETEILRLLGDGESLSAIADKLGVAYKTVANTATRIKEKLGLERTGDLIRFAVENRHMRVGVD